MIKLIGSFVVTASCLFAALAYTQPVNADEGCSDSGRACSVDRNCCSGSCVHGNCK